jgi:hypothetical protein
VAGRYLQADGRRPEEVADLARELSDVLDRYFTQSLTSLSTAASGDLTDGLDANRERIPLSSRHGSVDLFLARVTDPTAGSIWLFSSGSLANVSALSQSPQASWVESIMPSALVARTFLGASLAQWILWATSILAPLLLFWTVALSVVWIARWRIADLTRRAVFISWWRGIRWLIVIGLTLVVHLAILPLLGFSLTFRYAYARIGLVVAVIVVAFLVWRLVAVTFNHASLLAMRRGRSDRRSLIQLGERIVKGGRHRQCDAWPSGTGGR